MEALSQVDVTAPDHVSVITRDGKVTISVLKNGQSVTLGFPIRDPWIDSTPRPPLQQTQPLMVKRQGSIVSSSGDTSGSAANNLNNDPERLKELGRRFKTKLTESQAFELKQILADPELMSKFRSKTNAYKQLGQMYGISGARVQQIANGDGWKHLKV